MFERLATEFLPQVGVEHGPGAPAADAGGHPGRVRGAQDGVLRGRSGPADSSRTSAARTPSRTLKDYIDGRGRQRLGLHAERRRTTPPSPSASPATSPGRRPRHPRPGRHAQPVQRQRDRRHGHADGLLHLRLRRRLRPGRPDRSPSLTIATSADLPAGTTLNAGLGILGVSVDGAAGDQADYRLESTVATSWANPDNDAAGSLAFDNPGTATADDGELAADGAGTGIVTATQAGTLAGSLEAKPRANDRVAGLPSVGTTVTLSSAAPATFEAPLVTAVVPDAAKPFLTMTPRDLAAGLSQAASAVLGMQNAEDGNLPLMRGSIANAIDAVGGIKAFLANQVPDADTDDRTPGQPKFASLQDMLAALDVGASTPHSGWTIDVLGTGHATTRPRPYDATTKKVNFTVGTTRGGVTDLELNILGAATSGTGTYSATGLTATGVDFGGTQGTPAPTSPAAR